LEAGGDEHAERVVTPGDHELRGAELESATAEPDRNRRRCACSKHLAELAGLQTEEPGQTFERTKVRRPLGELLRDRPPLLTRLKGELLARHSACGRANQRAPAERAP